MKILTKTERNGLKLAARAPRKLRAAIRDLEVGQSLLILREDMRAKHGPIKIVQSVCREMQRQIEVNALLDGSGWVLDRLK